MAGGGRMPQELWQGLAGRKQLVRRHRVRPGGLHVGLAEAAHVKGHAPPKHGAQLGAAQVQAQYLVPVGVNLEQKARSSGAARASRRVVLVASPGVTVRASR